MSTHTPGPWRISRDEDGIKIYDGNDTKVADVGGVRIGNEAVEEKNAHVIVAAPELLERLEGCVDSLHIVIRATSFVEGHNDDFERCNHIACEYSRALIAKAKGQEIPQ